MEPNQTGHSNEPVEQPSAVDTFDTEDRPSGKTRNTVIAVLVVLMMLLGVLYVMEKQGRIETNMFGMFDRPETVATVNGSAISEEQLAMSISQLEQAAAVQGVDITSPDAQADIRDQALEVLINTELLTQAAAERGISVTTEEVEARIAEIEIEVGGAEVLAERMEELSINDATLRTDVESEMVISALLDELFAEADLTVTDEEITSIYDAAVASGANVPALEEVRPQVEQQIRTSKEQEVVDTYIAELKAAAEIETAE